MFGKRGGNQGSSGGFAKAPPMATEVKEKAPAPAPAPARAPLTRARPPDLGVRARHGVRLRHRDQRAVSPVVCRSDSGGERPW